MAVMIPGMRYKDVQKDFNGSNGEYKLYAMLEQLPQDYYIFHSTSWNERRRSETIPSKSYVQWGEADFTIYYPPKGIIVFEVKDGLISYLRERGWVQTNRNTGEGKIIDPMEQAEKSKYYFRDRVFHPAFGGNVPFRFCSAVWFTSGDRSLISGNLPLNYNEDTVLWAEDMASVQQVQNAINRVFRYYDAVSTDSSAETVGRVLDLLAPEFGMVRSIRVQSLANEALFHLMTREQNRLLDYLEEQKSAAIQGAAGTGKTVMAIEKAKRLESDGPVLLLCFNRFLMEYIRQLLEGKHPGISVYTIDGLFTKLTGTTHQFETGEERCLEILDFLTAWQQYNFPFKHIIVDEGQDFNELHLQALSAIAEEKDGCFYVFYDKNQFVQGQAYPQWLDHMECRLVLSYNCRNTHEIALTSTRPIEIPEKKIRINPYAEDTEQPKPTFYFAGNIQTLQAYLLQLIRKYSSAKVKKSDMVILSMKPEGNSILDWTNMIPELAAVCSNKKENNRVLLTTVRKFKGLEAEAVFCIDVDAKTFDNETGRNLFYVGTSRAKTWLDILTVSSQEEIAVAVTEEDIPRKRPQAIKTIRDRLQVKIGTQDSLQEMTF